MTETNHHPDPNQAAGSTAARNQPVRVDDLDYLDEDEISLFDLWDQLWPQRNFIIIFCLCCTLIAVGVALWLPKIYRAEALLAPVGSENSKGGLSSALGSLGGLASLAGIPMPSQGSVEENLAVLKSREFIGKFIREKKLLPVLFADQWDAAKKQWTNPEPDDQPSEMDAYRLFSENILRISQDKKSALVTVAVEWSDPQLAAEWTNELIRRLNDYLRQRAIDRSQKNLQYLNDSLEQTRIEEMRNTLFSLIGDEQKKAMLANTQEDYAFQLIDPAVEPDQKIKPKRKLIVVAAAVLSLFSAIFFVIFRDSYRNRKLRSLS